MKKACIVFISLLSLSLFAQERNQLDASGERHGVWSKNFATTDQPRYQGQFEHGKETGLFKYYKLVGGKSILSATKNFDMQTGIAEVEFLSSKGKLISKGKMKGRNYIGNWVYYQNKSEGILSTETYDDNGLLQGEKLVYYEGGKIAERAIYKDGKLNGLNVWYNEEGKVLKEMNYVDGELHGSAKYYSPEGMLVADGQFRYDKKHGIWKYYNADGTFKEEKDYTVRSKNPKKQHKD